MPASEQRTDHAVEGGEEPPTASRPRTRGDCADGPRPCPWVGCRHHLAIEVGAGGSLKLNFPDLEVHEMGETCSLDVADRGAVTLHEAGVHVGLTRERVRQIENSALATAAIPLRRVTR